MSKYKANINLKDKNNTLTNIFSRVKENSKIIDVGCASGYFDKVLKEKKGCEIVGIEIDKEDARQAEKYCDQVIVADVETEKWEKELKIKKFDHVIFADLLEHLGEPEKVLERVKKYLTDSGSVLVSIPNIAHVSVRLELLLGDFIPESTGILDDTHLKYFTKDSFSNLIRSVGYDIKWVSQSSFDFPENKIDYYLSKIGLKITPQAAKNLTSPEAVALEYIFEIIPGSVSATIDRVNEKPFYVVRELLKSIEKDHEKFKQDEIKSRKILEEELASIYNSSPWRIVRAIKHLKNRIKSRIKN